MRNPREMRNQRVSVVDRCIFPFSILSPVGFPLHRFVRLKATPKAQKGPQNAMLLEMST